MKTTSSYIARKPLLKSDILANTHKPDKMLVINSVGGTMSHETFYNRLTDIFKTTFVLSDSILIEDRFEDCYDNCAPLNITQEAVVDLLSNVVASKRKIIDILSENFKNKYITPFLLYSLGYKYEEIASVLVLPVSIVKSRVFYVQKKMQIILTNLDSR